MAWNIFNFTTKKYFFNFAAAIAHRWQFLCSKKKRHWHRDIIENNGIKWKLTDRRDSTPGVFLLPSTWNHHSYNMSGAFIVMAQNVFHLMAFYFGNNDNWNYEENVKIFAPIIPGGALIAKAARSRSLDKLLASISLYFIDCVLFFVVVYIYIQ